MKASELVMALQKMMIGNGDQEVLIDDCMALRVVEDVDMDASDAGIVIWAGSVA